MNYDDTFIDSACDALAANFSQQFQLAKAETQSYYEFLDKFQKRLYSLRTGFASGIYSIIDHRHNFNMHNAYQTDILLWTWISEIGIEIYLFERVLQS